VMIMVGMCVWLEFRMFVKVSIMMVRMMMCVIISVNGVCCSLVLICLW